MKPTLTLFVFCFMVHFLIGCAIAPVTDFYSGRSVGKGKFLVDGGVVLIGSFWPFVNGFYGVTKDLDVGIQYELFNYGAVLKYSLVNNQEQGISFSLLGSFGKSLEGEYMFAGAVISYKKDGFEPYFVTRYNHVIFPGKDFGGFSISAGSYDYLYFTLGSFFWFNPKVAMVGEVSVFQSTNRVANSPILGSVAAAVRF